MVETKASTLLTSRFQKQFDALIHGSDAAAKRRRSGDESHVVLDFDGHRSDVVGTFDETHR